MKVLTAARPTWSGVEVGVCDCPPGELMKLGDTCECECHPDDEEDCGCGLDCRDGGSFVGLVSDRETTTARIEESDLTPRQLSAAVRASMGRAGWFGPGLAPEIETALVEIEVARIRKVVRSYAAGTLVALTHGMAFEVSGTGEVTTRRSRA